MTSGLGLRRFAGLATLVVALVAAGAAMAGTGQPSPWQLNFQGAASEVMQDIHSFHWFLLVIITAISLFVMALLIVCIVRYNERANPVASRTTHNTAIEVVWTVVPVLILVAIAIPSFRLLYEEQTIPKSDLTVKTIGKQWFWTIEYPDDKVTFDVFMLTDKERKANQPRLLAVDNDIVVPIGKVVRVQVTAADVLHAFAVPSFGVKVDAIPGRLNETWFRATQEGVFYGQCSELCGKDHAFMPLAVRVVSEDRYKAWLAEAKKRAATGQPPASVAEVDALTARRQASLPSGARAE